MSSLLVSGSFASLFEGDLEWARPAGFAALLLPLLILILSRRPQPPRDEATGALAIWSELAARSQLASARERRGLPWRLILLLSALVLSAIAVAGPRRSRADLSAVWTVTVDRSPSMYLPLEVGGAERRIERALAQAGAWLDELGVAERARSWSDGGGLRHAAQPPEAWLRAPRTPRAAPRWERFDGAGQLWLMDVAPGLSPSSASWLAVGGAAIPGEVGGGTRWDGTDLLASSSSAMGRVVAEGLNPLIAELLGLWCEERGFELSGEKRDARLVVSTPLTTEAVASSSAGRDGWRIDGAWQAAGAPRVDDLGELEEWLAPHLVSQAAGRVYVALGSEAELHGDPADFAVSWAQLFDRACLAELEVVSLAERRAAGEGGRRLGALPAAVRREAHESELEAWLYLASLALAGLWALGLASRS